jgi:ubiquinone/menaquinone biosynthesis C-methylase UbiE
MVISILLSIILFQFCLLCWLFFKRKDNSEVARPASFNNPERVGAFYNETTDKFLAVYGEIIQAFRTTDVSEYLHYTKESMQLEAGMTVIDAGCGVCGPACFFAKEIPYLKIDAVTISSVQFEKSRVKILEQKLHESIKVKVADYHLLDWHFAAQTYDRVYFLESFGHSNDKEKVINAAWKVLKPGGKLYIKDLFLRIGESDWEQKRINEIAEQINSAYEYQIGDLNEVLTSLRKKGFILNFVKVPQVKRELFENLTISNDFQNLFGIGKIDSWENYVFPIDFFEILAEKPTFDTMKEMHLYFMNRK